MESRGIEIFCCYAHKDRELLIELKKQLKPLLRYQPISMDLWYDARVLPGAEWGSEVYKHLNSAHIILLLVSPDFMASDYHEGVEIRHAMERHKRGEVQVVPIILRPVHWQKAPFGALQALPEEAKPVTSWPNQDEALFDAVEGINKVIEALCHKQAPTAKTADLPSLTTRPNVPSLSTRTWEWEQYTRSQTLVLRHSEPIASVALTPGDNLLASDGWDNELICWKVYPNKAQRERTMAQLPQPLYTVSFSPDGSLLASGGDDGIVRMWDTETGHPLKILEGHTSPVSCVAFSPNRYMLASASDDHTIKIWDTKTGHALRTLEGHTDSVSCVAFSPDGSMLASASYDTSVKVWDSLQGHLLSTLTHHQDTVHCVTFLSYTDIKLASADHRGYILIYSPTDEIDSVRPLLPEKWDIEQVLRQPGPVYSIVSHQPSKALISGAHDGTVTVWEPSTGQVLKTFTEHKKAVSCVAVSPKGNIIVSGSLDNTIQVRPMQAIIHNSGSPVPSPPPYGPGLKGWAGFIVSRLKKKVDGFIVGWILVIAFIVFTLKEGPIKEKFRLIAGMIVVIIFIVITLMAIIGDGNRSSSYPSPCSYPTMPPFPTTQPFPTMPPFPTIDISPR